MTYLLEVKGLSIEVSVNKKIKSVLKDVDFKLKRGEITSLIGRSGEGKTVFSLSLLNLLSNKFKITKGEVKFNEKNININDLKNLRGKEIFYIPQNSQSSLNPTLKIKKQINETRRVGEERMIKILKDLGFKDYKRILNSYPFEISGGQAQRVVLAIGLCLNPELLIFDEPTSSLDEKNRIAFGKLIKEIVNKYKKSILLISHNLEFVKMFSDTVYEIHDNKISKISNN